MMNALRTLLTSLAFGALGGGVISALIARSYLPWMATPAMGQALCDCERTSKGVANQIIHYESIGLLIGALLGLALGVAWVVRSRRQGPGAGATPGAMPPPGSPAVAG